MEEFLVDNVERDEERDLVLEKWRFADPGNLRAADVIRATFDQLYDGLHTGRYRWEQLYKTEKTHFGTLFEINLRREFRDVIQDGLEMDYLVGGVEIDCKYSQKDGGWMIPPEAVNHLLLVATANDAIGVWSLGVVRARPGFLRSSSNRDGKTQLNPEGRRAVAWLARQQSLPPNVLISLPQDIVDRIFSRRSGQARINELLRVVTNRRIGRNTIATVAQQEDYMKRIRYNGGARSALEAEGFIIPGGDYQSHRQVAMALDAVVPRPGEIVSLALVPAIFQDPHTVFLDGAYWRLARVGEKYSGAAPTLPDTRRQQ